MRQQNMIKNGVLLLAASSVLMCAVASAQTAPKYIPEQAKSLSEWSHTLAIAAATWGSPAVINADRPKDTAQWQLRFQVQFLFPK